jgi:hypothetical protein
MTGAQFSYVALGWHAALLGLLMQTFAALAYCTFDMSRFEDKTRGRASIE